jgi:hypothetical protein
VMEAALSSLLPESHLFCLFVNQISLEDPQLMETS